MVQRGSQKEVGLSWAPDFFVLIFTTLGDVKVNVKWNIVVLVRMTHFTLFVLASVACCDINREADEFTYIIYTSTLKWDGYSRRNG